MKTNRYVIKILISIPTIFSLKPIKITLSITKKKRFDMTTRYSIASCDNLLLSIRRNVIEFLIKFVDTRKMYSNL